MICYRASQIDIFVISLAATLARGKASLSVGLAVSLDSEVGLVLLDFSGLCGESTSSIVGRVRSLTVCEGRCSISKFL